MRCARLPASLRCVPALCGSGDLSARSRSRPSASPSPHTHTWRFGRSGALPRLLLDPVPVPRVWRSSQIPWSSPQPSAKSQFYFVGCRQRLAAVHLLLPAVLASGPTPPASFYKEKPASSAIVTSEGAENARASVARQICLKFLDPNFLPYSLSS